MKKSEVVATINRHNIDASKTQLKNIDNKHSNNLSDLEQRFEPFQVYIQRDQGWASSSPEKTCRQTFECRNKDILLSNFDYAKLVSHF